MDAGVLFGKYRIQKQIGRGGMGIVYLAEDCALARLVAIKVLDKEITSSPLFEQRFLQEARTIASLNHPNILPIYALSHIEDCWAIEMPYISGGSLMDAELRGNLDVHRVLTHTRDILLALAVCHESGIIHRDVKPSNILLGENGTALLSDFGLAKVLAAHQQDSLRASHSSSLFIGTPRYAPPESWEEQAPTAAWDIYSVGMVLYEAISGSTPYDAETLLGLMKQLLERPVPPLKEVAPSVSQELSDLVSRMLFHDPAARFQDVADVLEAFWALPELSGDSPSPPVLVKPHAASKSLSLAPSHARLSGTRKTKTSFKVGLPFFLILLAAGASIFALSRYVIGSSTAPLRRKHIASETLSVNNVGDFLVFDSVDMQNQETLSAHCIGKINRDAPSWQLVAVGPEHLWFMELYSRPDGLMGIEGYWADYDRDSTMVFRHGSIAGKGRWVRSNEDVATTLTFKNLETGLEWNESLLFRHSDTPPLGSGFLCALTASDAVPSLLYNEILPRRLPWAKAVEVIFQEAGLAQITVPKYKKNETVLELDGQLREAAWHIELGEDAATTGLAIPVEGPEGTFMRLWHDEEGLVLGIHVASSLISPRLLIALQTSHAISALSSRRWIIQADNGVILASKTLGGDPGTPWNCTWQMAQHASKGVWEVEIKIPFDELGVSSPFITEQRWFLNCQVGQVHLNRMKTMAQWGHDILEKTSCGLMLALYE